MPFSSIMNSKLSKEASDMAGSSFGTIFRITTWGESHGKALGAVIDGCPAGLELNEQDIQYYLDLRKPGHSAFSTQRRENDRVQILSGVFEGKTTGTPISLMIENTGAHSSDYNEIAGYYRPGHADYTYDRKYGFRDWRGGGRASARETAARVAGGAVALKLLAQLGISVLAYTDSVGPVKADPSRFDPDEILRNPIRMPDPEAASAAAQLISEKKAALDSVGGTIVCRISGLPAGLGDPVFDKLSAGLAKAIFSIPAVKGLEFGAGFSVARTVGSENNDAFTVTQDGSICKQSNNAGGMLGGISDGSEIFFRAAFKPTPSIASPQETVTRDGTPVTVEIKGRHDPVIMPRAVVVVQAMSALVLVDALMVNMTARVDHLEKFYR